MYIKKCPICNCDLIYKIKSSWYNSVKRNSVCKLCFSKKTSDRMKNRIVSNETKERLSNSHKGKKLSIEHREKISKSGKGKKKSEESKAKYSISKIGDITNSYCKCR